MNNAAGVLRWMATRILCLVCLLPTLPRTAAAQPILNFHGISVNWPTISLFVSAKCHDSLRIDLSKSNFHIRENGIDIGDFTITCPDPNTHCCISVGLLIDRSGSMAPPFGGLNGAKAGAKAFVGAMDGGCDEATLISFDSLVTVDVSMTHDTVALKAGIDKLYAPNAYTGTSIWDAVIVGVQQLVAKGTQQCRALILLTDGEDVTSKNSINAAIAAAKAAKLRVFTIGLGVGINDADLTRLANETGGKYYKVPNSSELVKIYKEISAIIASGFDQCEIQYQAKCMDGTTRIVELTLQQLARCAGTDTKIKTYTAPLDTSTFKPIDIALGEQTVRGGQNAEIPLLLETAVSPADDGPFNVATFTVLFDDQCCQFLGISTKGFLLDGVGVDVISIPGGIQCTTQKGKGVDGPGILAMLYFKTSDPDQDTECPLTLASWTFQAGCLRPARHNGKIIIQARRPELDCTLDMPQELLFDHDAKDYSPNPFPVLLTVTNLGDREARNGVATITFNPLDLSLAGPLTDKQSMTPKIVGVPNGTATARWDLLARRRTKGDSIEVCITVTYDNAPTLTCCRKIWVPQAGPILNCKLSAPAIKTNAARDRYVPMPFTLTADVWNDGGMLSDTLFATISLTPDLQLGPTEKGRAIKTVSPVRLAPGQHGTVQWELDHPIAVDQKNYIVTVVIRQRNIDSISCEIPILIPPLLAPLLTCQVQAPNELSYDSTADIYSPNPFTVTVGVTNTGGLDADSVRATIILPPDLVLNPPGQPLTRYFNPMLVVRWASGLPANEVSWTVQSTRKPKTRKCYPVKIRIDGTANTGPTQPTYCEKEVCVPPVAGLLACDLYAPDSLALNAQKTSVVPNPFPVRFVVRNVGKRAVGVKDAQLFVENATGVFIQPAYPNPVDWNALLSPKDTIDALWKLQVANSRTPRTVRVRAVAIDEDGDPVECFKEIPIARLDVALSCSAAGPDTIHYDRIAGVHIPDPFTGKFDLINTGADALTNIEVEVKNLPAEVALDAAEPAVKTIAALSPSQRVQLQWNFVLTGAGKALAAGKTVRIGVSYRSNETPLIENDCGFDLFIQPVNAAQLQCRLIGPDTLHFVDDRYTMNPFDVQLTVWNPAAGPADEVKAYLLQDPQFTIVPPASRDLTPSLLPRDSVSSAFELKVNPRETSGWDTVRVAVTANGTVPAYCEWPIYIFKEARPRFSLICRAAPDTLLFSEAANDYAPNPFTVSTVATNVGDNVAQNCQMVFVAPNRFTIAGGSPISRIGPMDVNRSDSVVWQVRALRRDIGGMDTLVFQVQGYGGLGNRIVVAECRVPVYVAAGRAAKYSLDCRSQADSLTFDHGQYQPDPFTISVKVRNSGKADGRQIAARIALPALVDLAPGEQPTKALPDLAPGDSVTVGWALRALPRAADGTLNIQVLVTDPLGGEGSCVRQVFVPRTQDALLALQCSAPDTLRIDPALGDYFPNPFTASILVQNQGQVKADSVAVRICLECDDPTSHTLRIFDPPVIETVVAASLDPGAQVKQDWKILALPRTKSGLAQIKFTVTARGLAPRECVVYVFIGPLGAPALDCMKSATTPDTLHFDPAIGMYEGTRSTAGGAAHTYFLVRFDVRNIGTAQSRNTRATLLLPVGITLEEGESPTKDVTPSVLNAGQDGTVSWKCKPIRQAEGALRRLALQLTGEKSSPQQCFAELFIQGAPKISLLSIPRNNLGSYGDKVLVPVHIDETVGKDIGSYRFTLSFDPRVVRFVQVLTKGTMTEWGWTGARAQVIGAANDLVEVSDFTTGWPLSKGSGPIVLLMFEGVFGGPGSSLSIDSSELKFTEKMINSGEVGVLSQDGLITISSECIKPLAASGRYSMKQNRPNPFNPSTDIEYTLPEDTYMTLRVLDALGREIRTLAEGERAKGTYVTTFFAGSIPNGVYYYKIETPHYRKVMRMTLMK